MTDCPIDWSTQKWNTQINKLNNRHVKMKIDGENYRAKDREEERNRALKREGAKRDVNGCLSRESSAILCSLSGAAIEREEIWEW